MKNSYVRFLNTVHALKRTNPARTLDATEIEILEYLLLSTYKNQALLVGDVIVLNRYGSQATLHGRIKNLVVLGYLNLIQDKVDGRKKAVVPTKLAFKYIEFLSGCMSKSPKMSS
jgi:DNA-binding MarR family transcriptional regulator